MKCLTTAVVVLSFVLCSLATPPGGCLNSCAGCVAEWNAFESILIGEMQPKPFTCEQYEYAAGVFCYFYDENGKLAIRNECAGCTVACQRLQPTTTMPRLTMPLPSPLPTSEPMPLPTPEPTPLPTPAPTLAPQTSPAVTPILPFSSTLASPQLSTTTPFSGDRTLQPSPTPASPLTPGPAQSLSTLAPSPTPVATSRATTMSSTSSTQTLTLLSSPFPAKAETTAPTGATPLASSLVEIEPIRLSTAAITLLLVESETVATHPAAGGDAASGSGTLPFWAWILIGVGAFLVVSSILFVMFRVRRQTMRRRHAVVPSSDLSTEMRPQLDRPSSVRVSSNHYQSLARRQEPRDSYVVGDLDALNNIGGDAHPRESTLYKE
jgi:hypothetical protein